MNRDLYGVLLALVMVLATVAHSAAPVLPRVTYLDCPKTWKCPACDYLKRKLQEANKMLNFQQSIPGKTDKMPLAFPTVHYSKGKPDNGEKFYQGKASVPNHIQIIEWE